MTTIVPDHRERSRSIDVLQVDDEPDLADVVGTYLERRDDRIAVTTAVGAQEGLDHLDEGDFDCVVSDYDMPGKSGIEFLEAVREDHADLPFILYTGKGSEEVASDAISAGVTDYLQKESGTSQYAVLANRIVNAVEQNRSRRAVEETERKLSELAEKTDDVLFMMNGDWSELLFVNSAYEDIWGGPIAELERDTESFLEYVHPDDRESVRRSMRRLSSGEPGALVYRIARPDGEVRWVRAESKPIFDDAGTVSRIVGFVRDVTERKERERELRRKERRYQAVFNDPNILVGLIDPDGTVLDINQTAMEYVDASLEEVRGRPFPETPWFDHSDSLQEEVETWIDRAASGEYVEFEADLGGSGPEQYTIEGVFRPVTNDDGEVVSLLISDRDVTEQRERERELERVKSRFQAFVEHASDVTTVLDDSGEIRYESPSIERHLGYDREELVGESAFEYIHPDDRERVTETFSGMTEQADTEMVRVEYRFKHADGSWVWLESAASPRTDSVIGGYVVTSRDVTGRKERERELRRQNDRLDEFASVVSHDLRNPLNVAVGRLELAQRECDSDHLEAAERAHERMNELVDSLLALARQGEEVGSLEPVDVETFTEQCWQHVDTADATLRTDLDGRILADRSRLRQLLENLFRNALEHGPAGVTVTVGELEAGFSVEDDGPGIPDGKREDVFEAGYSTKAEGTGVGLRIVEDVVDGHGWDVCVTDGTEGGTRFEITGVKFEA